MPQPAGRVAVSLHVRFLRLVQQQLVSGHRTRRWLQRLTGCRKPLRQQTCCHGCLSRHLLLVWWVGNVSCYMFLVWRVCIYPVICSLCGEFGFIMLYVPCVVSWECVLLYVPCVVNLDLPCYMFFVWWVGICPVTCSLWVMSRDLSYYMVLEWWVWICPIIFSLCSEFGFVLSAVYVLSLDLPCYIFLVWVSRDLSCHLFTWWVRICPSWHPSFVPSP